MSFITFGEIMLRLSPEAYATKIGSSRSFTIGYAGSESNVASSLGVLGNEVSYVTKLPQNPLGDAAVASLKSFGIDTTNILRGGNRIGTYFIESGSSIRPSSVIYDRAGSAISKLSGKELIWEKILEGRKWLFLSGITPALSAQCAKETIKAAQTAKMLGVKVAFDMNYRRSLWQNPLDARNIFDQILEHTDILFGNAGVLKDVYDFKLPGRHEEERTWDAALKAHHTFGIPQLAFTIRKHISASKNVVSGIHFSGSGQYHSSTYDVDIADRLGTGDAFAAACLHALHLEWKLQDVIDFGAAAFALKHTIKGDQHTSTENEILSIAKGNINGHVLR